VQNVVTDDAGIESLQTVCTASSIDEQRGMFLTANHCVNSKQVRVNWQIAWVVKADVKLDLAVLQSPGVRLPALKPYTGIILAGMDIASFGHAYGWELPLFRGGHVSHPYMLVPEVTAAYPYLDGRFLVMDYALIGGMSGGPVVNPDGLLVSINQMGNGVQGLGQPIDVILGATAGFWAGQ
jgi:S1-C subfamily serine protease